MALAGLNDLFTENLDQLLLTGGFFAASNDELLDVLENCAETQFELMSYAWCEIRRRAKPPKIGRAERICDDRELTPIPWLADARKALDVLSAPTGKKHTCSTYVILRDGYTDQNGYFGLYVGVTSKSPEARFREHTSPGHRLAAKGLPEHGICLLRTLMHPFVKVPAREKLHYETALHLALSLIVPKVSGDIRNDYLTWLPEFQPRLMKALDDQL